MIERNIKMNVVCVSEGYIEMNMGMDYVRKNTDQDIRNLSLLLIIFVVISRGLTIRSERICSSTHVFESQC